MGRANRANLATKCVFLKKLGELSLSPLSLSLSTPVSPPLSVCSFFSPSSRPLSSSKQFSGTVHPTFSVVRTECFGKVTVFRSTPRVRLYDVKWLLVLPSTSPLSPSLYFLGVWSPHVHGNTKFGDKIGRYGKTIALSLPYIYFCLTRLPVCLSFDLPFSFQNNHLNLKFGCLLLQSVKVLGYHRERPQ